jgi:zinc transport system substrate-binding protein
VQAESSQLAIGKYMIRLFTAITLSTSIFTAIMGAKSQAQELRIVTDIAPIYALVASVMGEQGQPHLLLGNDEDAHSFQLRPSQARALAQSDLIIWTGDAMLPFLSDVIETYGKSNQSLPLLQSAGTFLMRGDHASGHTSEHTSESGHTSEHASENSGIIDPHAWLNPTNAAIWLGVISERLSRIDPSHASSYQKNALAAARRLTALDAELIKILTPIQSRGFVVSHDAFGYFASSYGLNSVGAIQGSDAESASAAHLSQLRADFIKQRVVCFFPEIGHDSKLGAQLAMATGVKIGAPLDPEGVGLEPSAALYEELMRKTAHDLRACLQE